MGWWSEDIMGGDSPLDFQGAIFEKLGSSWNAKGVNKKQSFEGASPQVLAELIPSIVEQWGCGEPGEDFHTDQTSIGYQVLALEMMACGAPISDSLRTEMVRWIPLDGWSQEDSGRLRKVQHLLTSLQSYTGSPTVIESKGLLQVYAELKASKS